MRYLALGDSISIDEYPLRETGRPGLGAASLFHRNDDHHWPEYRGRDLVTRFPSIEVTDLTADGATTEDVVHRQLPRVAASNDETIVTVTAGGNDLLMNLRNPMAPSGLVDGILARIDTIVKQLQRKLPGGRILIGTVYDPSDGMNVLNGERLDREAEWLARLNDAIRSLPGVTIIDIHRHFLGHGLTAPANERWYWSGLIFEPSARGASEVRRLWLEAEGM